MTTDLTPEQISKALSDNRSWFCGECGGWADQSRVLRRIIRQLQREKQELEHDQRMRAMKPCSFGCGRYVDVRYESCASMCFEEQKAKDGSECLSCHQVFPARTLTKDKYQECPSCYATPEI